jgi:potassium-transporting ATPase KdpC subunit
MRKLRNDLLHSALAVIALTVILGLVYPLVLTGISQLAFSGKANGSKIEVNGKVVGSSLLSQPFTIPNPNGKRPSHVPNPRYFQPRPSQDSYDAAATFFSNRGPNQRDAKTFYRHHLARYLALERRYDPGLSAADVPVDAVTTSASGVDPEISVANARIQAHRVAAVRHLPLSEVNRLVDDNTDHRDLGILGEAGVNVLELNLALDRLGGRR